MGYNPSIILVDNVEMHVESKRHIKLINAMKECYPNAQIFATTHSYHVSRNVSERSQVYDLRIIHSNDCIKKQPWRLYIIDEISDALVKLENLFLSDPQDKKFLKEEGEKLLQCCFSNDYDVNYLKDDVKEFIGAVEEIYIENLINIK